MGSESIAHEAEAFEDSRDELTIFCPVHLAGLLLPGCFLGGGQSSRDPVAKNSTQSPAYPASHASN